MTLLNATTDINHHDFFFIFTIIVSSYYFQGAVEFVDAFEVTTLDTTEEVEESDDEELSSPDSEA
jgi:hypothetical protein